MLTSCSSCCEAVRFVCVEDKEEVSWSRIAPSAMPPVLPLTSCSTTRPPRSSWRITVVSSVWSAVMSRGPVDSTSVWASHPLSKAFSFWRLPESGAGLEDITATGATTATDPDRSWTCKKISGKIIRRQRHALNPNYTQLPKSPYTTRTMFMRIYVYRLQKVSSRLRVWLPN